MDKGCRLDLHDRVGRGGARGDADAHGAVESERVLLHEDVAVHVAVLDRVVGPDAPGVRGRG